MYRQGLSAVSFYVEWSVWSAPVINYSVNAAFFKKCSRTVMNISWVPTMCTSHIEKLSKYSSLPPPTPLSLQSLPEIHLHFLLSTVCPPGLTQAAPLTAFCLIICKSNMCFQSWALMNIYGIIYAGVKHTMAPFCIVKRSGILCTERQY